MKNLIFDETIFLALWLKQSGFEAIEKLFVKTSSETLKAWISASSLPLLESLAINAFENLGMLKEDAVNVVKDLILNLGKNVSILSNNGFEQLSYYKEISNFYEAQVAIAGTALNSDTIIVTNKDSFDALGLIKIKNPDSALEWIEENHTINKMEFIDLKAQQDILRPQLEQNIYNVLRSGQYIMGEEILKLEKKLANYVGVKNCIAVSSGTDALLISMLALGIGAGDEVITSPFTFMATGEMISLLGAKPVFVDVDPKTYNLDPDKIERAITKCTRAIIPVNIYGQCSDFGKINLIAAKYNIPVIEDAAQSLGAEHNGYRSGALSTIGCTSFFPSKPLGGYGDSGACFTDDDELAIIMRQILVHGQDKRYHHIRLGINGRMDTIQAAILLAKFDLFEKEVIARKSIGDTYTRLLQVHCPNVITPFIEVNNASVYAQYTIQVEGREELQGYLKEEGIPTAVHYPIPLHQQPALMTNEFDLPVAEFLSKRVMSLPMHPYLNTNDPCRIT